MIAVDSSPDFEAKGMVQRLDHHNVKSQYTLINCVGSLMQRVSKVFFGATSVLSNGAVISKVGTGLISCMAQQVKVPVVFFSETYKFSEKVNLQNTEMNNQIGNPD